MSTAVLQKEQEHHWASLIERAASSADAVLVPVRELIQYVKTANAGAGQAAGLPRAIRVVHGYAYWNSGQDQFLQPLLDHASDLSCTRLHAEDVQIISVPRDRGSRGLSALFRVTAAFASIQSLSWQSHAPDDPMCLVDALRSPHTLAALHLSFPAALPTWRLARMLAAILPRTPALRCLALRTQGKRDWSRVLRELRCRPCLSLLAVYDGSGASWRSLMRDALPACAASLLGLVINNVEYASAVTLRAGLVCCTLLQRLCLHACIQTRAVGRALADVLRTLPHLTWLEVSNARVFADDGACAICDVISPAVLSLVPRLQLLSLPLCHVTDAEASALAASLCHLPSLHTLLLCFNAIRDAGIAALAGALPHLPLLHHLNLEENPASDAGMAVLMRGLAATPLLRRVDVQPAHTAARHAFLRHALPALHVLEALELCVPLNEADDLALLASGLRLLPQVEMIRLFLPDAVPLASPPYLAAVAAACVLDKPLLRHVDLRVQADVYSRSSTLRDFAPGDALVTALADALAVATQHRLAAPLLHDLTITGFPISTAPLARLVCVLQLRVPVFRALHIVCGQVALLMPEAITQLTGYQRSVQAQVLARDRQLYVAPSSLPLPAPSLASLLELAATIVLARVTPCLAELGVEPEGDARAGTVAAAEAGVVGGGWDAVAGVDSSRLPYDVRPRHLARRLRVCRSCGLRTRAERQVMCYQSVLLGWMCTVEVTLCCLCYQPSA